MEKDLVKEAFGEALKDSENEKKGKIKKIILETLRKKVELEEEVKGLQQKIKILGKDLEDFKQGRLDLIEERQRVDETARKTSVMKVIRIEIEDNRIFPRPWFEPFKIIPVFPYYPLGTQWMSATSGVYSASDSAASFSSAGTDFHNFYSGAYEVGDKIFNL